MAVATIGWPALRIAAELLIEEQEKKEAVFLLDNIQEESAWRVDDGLVRLAQTPGKNGPTTNMPPAKGIWFVRALYNYSSSEAGGLDFHKGDIIQVLAQFQSGWSDGLIDDRRGWFPGNYCDTLESATVVDFIPRPGLSLPGSQKSPTAKRYTCPHCPTEYTKKHKLKSHLLTHEE